MRDSDIRAALVASLRASHAGTDTLIRNEDGICAGRRRIDVAVVNGELAGYEIKSDVDTLSRLQGQADAYGQVLDRASVVVTQRHVDHALAVVPRWWGVWLAESRDDGVQLSELQPGGANESWDAYALCQLLWRDEALSELTARGLARGLSRKARHYIWLTLSESLVIDELRELVRQRLKERRGWPGGA
jgi:hypothetical protein